MGKVFTTTNAQLKKLRAKGMAISNGSRAKKIIELENYYNLINGYKPLFLKQSGTDETYKEGTRFEEVYALYILTASCAIFLCGTFWKLKTTSKVFSPMIFPRNMAPMVICGWQALTPVSSRESGKRLLRRLVMSRI